MSIQTTQNISREQAEEKFVDKEIAEAKLLLIKEASLLTDKELEIEIESTFWNYIITKENNNA